MDGNASGGVAPGALPDELIALVAERFRVLGEPTRIRLLDALRAGPATVGALHRAIGGTQQNVSRHLGLLLRAGLVTREQRGTSACYAIADPGVFELCDQVCGGLRREAGEHARRVGALGASAAAV